MNKNAYRGHRFPPAIIQVTVWMYARFTLSLRDVQELLPNVDWIFPTKPCAAGSPSLVKSMLAASDRGDTGQQTAGISTRW
jgi:hypothetical protein